MKSVNNGRIGLTRISLSRFKIASLACLIPVAIASLADVGIAGTSAGGANSERVTARSSSHSRVQGSVPSSAPSTNARSNTPSNTPSKTSTVTSTRSPASESSEPFKTSLKVLVPKEWTYAAAAPGVSKLGFEEPGFQGNIRTTESTSGDPKLYEVSVYVYERNATQPLGLQIETALSTAAPQYENKLVKHVREEKEAGNRGGAFRLLEAPYGNSAVSTVLYSNAGEKTIVIVKSVVAGSASGNTTVQEVKTLIEGVRFEL